MAEIVLEHLTKRFENGFEAVKDAHFTIHDGEFFILVGPSGGGKSTLLNSGVHVEERVRLGFPARRSGVFAPQASFGSTGPRNLTPPNLPCLGSPAGG